MVAFPRTNGQAMVLHRLHFLCPHGEPRNPQGPHVRCELPTSGLRDVSVDGPHPQPLEELGRDVRAETCSSRRSASGTARGSLPGTAPFGRIPGLSVETY